METRRLLQQMTRNENTILKSNVLNYVKEKTITSPGAASNRGKNPFLLRKSNYSCTRFRLWTCSLDEVMIRCSVGSGGEWADAVRSIIV